MQWLEVKVSFAAERIETLTDLIADIFYDLGVQGVAIDDPVPDSSQDWGRDAVPPPAQPAVTGYLVADETLAANCAELSSRVGRLSHREGFHFSVAYRNLTEQDWAESWKAFFHPQKISARFVVKPTWRDYTPGSGEDVIEIDPGMAFGTGSHPTTTLCIGLLERHLQKGQSVLDVGTGSGILLIAAAKLGAGRMAGVDLDPMAVEVARANLTLNGIGEEAVILHCGNLADRVTETYDVVVANIMAEVILVLLDHLPRVLAPGGRFIGSGIIVEREAEVREKMIRCGFTDIAVEQRDEWVAVAGRRIGAG
jgi:ribosomal protein L11 methyltransferase